VAISYQEKASSTTATVTPTVDNDLKKVQTLLSELNFYDGAIDGVQGSKTTDAIKKAQTFYSLPTTGVLDAQTLAALKS
jgi:peptidoglycan hydrolase-like protein with peptidoglycan-binding domain